MTVLLRKEIRSLLPAWVMTISATALFAFVRPIGAPVLLVIVGIGCVLLGITSFGSEFSHGTFSLLLAQPTPRRKIWRTKTTALGAALLSIATILSVVFFCKFFHSGSRVQDFVGMPAIFALLFFGAAFAGGLLFTLTLRQTALAFWLALLFPFTLCGLAETFATGHAGKTITISIAAVLAAYDVLAFLLARREFLRVQDLPGDTGPTISLPGWRRLGTKTFSTTRTRSRYPLRALIAKELQLHQASLCVAAFLLVTNVLTVLVRRMIVQPGSSQSLLYGALISWSLLWIFFPVIIASSAIAEERRQGTLEGMLCLPARKSTQWFIKCAVCFFLSILFAGVMPWLFETAAHLIGCPWSFDRGPFADHGHFLQSVTVAASIMTLVVFYASSLSRNLLQAVGIAAVIGSVFIGFALQTTMMDNFQGDLSLLSNFLRFGLPVFFALFLWLSYTNFKHLTVGWRLWFHNTSVLLFAAVLLLWLQNASALLFAAALLCGLVVFFSCVEVKISCHLRR